jgi:putative nucleotidyltransferase with HDIG domain
MEGVTILVADPRDTERVLLGYLLCREGFSVHEARSATEAVEIAQSKPVHLIILDVAFWQGAETNVLATLKHYPQTKLIPVVLFGESRNREDLAAALQAGAAQWVTRNGFEVPTFLNKLHTVLGQQQDKDLTKAPSPAAQAAAPMQVACEKLTAVAVSEAFGSIDSLAAFEFNILDAITTTCSKDRTAEHISRIALRDPMLAAALLHTANTSANAHFPNGITDLSQAVDLVGSKGFYIVAESVPPLDARKQTVWFPAHFWTHSVATGRIAGMLSARLQLGTPADAVTAGLLHDVGRALLATKFGNHYKALVEAAKSCDCPSTQWERELVGLHHGEIAAHAFKQLGLPEMLRDVVLVHHESMSACQALKISTRLIALIVQAADQIANTVFPGDFPLTPLTDFAEECAAALESAKVSLTDVLHDARAIVGELTTEMAHQFPRAAADPHYYAQKPIPTLLYFAPGHKEFDLIRAFFEVRSQNVHHITRLSQQVNASHAPVVVNLSALSELSRQVEALTSVMASGVMRTHKGLVLLPSPPKPVHQAFVSETWRVLSLPAHPARWMPWLAETSQPAAQPPLETSVA